MFQDIHEKIVSAIRTVIPEFRQEDLSFDRTGHSDLTLRMFRYANEDIEKIRERIQEEKFVREVNILGKYLNIHVDHLELLKIISMSIDSTGQFPDTFQDPERVCVEHTSINPTGPIHVGRVRNSIIGDSISKLFKRYGYRVTTQYFVNDSGKQMMSLYLAYVKYNSGTALTPELLLDGYRKIYKEMEEQGSEGEVEEIIKKYEEGDPKLIENVRKIANVMLDEIKKELQELGIKIDDYTWESEFIVTGEVKTLIDSLEDVIKSEGVAKYIELKDGKKVFLTRSDGSSLYLVRDIAYHMYKLSQNDWIITVLGEDHAEHGRVLTEILKDYFDLMKKLDFVLYAFVSLESGKMSTRKGNAVTVRELIDRTYEKALDVVKNKRGEDEKSSEIARKVAISAIRFNILRVSSTKSLVFRWEDALDFNGDSAPFVMYSYVRAINIIKKNNQEKKVVDYNFSDIEMENEERKLIIDLYQYPYRISESLKNLKPEALANFAFSIAKNFNDFYEKCRVNVDNDEVSLRRLTIVNSFKSIVEDVSDIIGIELTTEM
ncbi:MAG: arginine--tRNA ligase [Thermoplasmataceae archaeon]